MARLSLASMLLSKEDCCVISVPASIELRSSVGDSGRVEGLGDVDSGSGTGKDTLSEEEDEFIDTDL